MAAGRTLACTVMFIILFLTSLVHGGGWDVDGDAPPPTSSAHAPAPPKAIEPFHLLLYQSCEVDSAGNATQRGQIGLELFSAYATVGFDAVAADTLVTLKVRTHHKAERQALVNFPDKPFVLRVILGDQLAVLHVTPGEKFNVQYTEPCGLLLLDSARIAPPSTLTFQFMPGTKASVLDFLDQLEASYGQKVEKVVLAEGYYPCLPASTVTSTVIGRKKRINRTPLGYLVCLQVRDASIYSEVQNWLSSQEHAERERSEADLWLRAGAVNR